MSALNYKLLTICTLIYYIFARIFTEHQEFVEYSAPLVFITSTLASQIFNKFFYLNPKLILFFICYTGLITLIHSGTLLEYAGYFYLVISLLFGYSFYYLSRIPSYFDFFMRCWVVLCFIAVPLGFLIPAGPRDFLGMPSTPSGGLYAVAMLFSFLLFKSTTNKKWLCLIPFFMTPFLISESFRYIFQISIFAAVFIVLTRPLTGAFALAGLSVLVTLVLQLPSIKELFLSNWRIENYLSGVDKLINGGWRSASAFSRDGINVRIGFLLELLRYLQEPQAFFGWGPNASYELLEKTSGRFAYSHNSIVEFILSYGYIGGIFFIKTFFTTPKKNRQSLLGQKLWIAFVFSCLCASFVNGKLYMLHSFWIAYFTIKISGERFSNA